MNEYKNIYKRAIDVLRGVKAKAKDSKIPEVFLDLVAPNPGISQRNKQSVKSNSINISISGWMSQETDKMHHWVGLLKYYQMGLPDDILDLNGKNNLFSLSWEASTPIDFNKQIGTQSFKIIISLIFNHVVSSGVKAVFNINKVAAALNLGQSFYQVYDEVVKLFKQSKANAKLAGKLLACALVLRRPFTHQTVSLIGFSLGTQVIKSCLKTIHMIYGLNHPNSESRALVPCDLI